MKAERDEDEFRGYVKPKQERRLAYEIAIGIIIGGSVLSALEAIGSYIAMRVAMGQVMVSFPGIQ